MMLYRQTNRKSISACARRPVNVRVGRKVRVPGLNRPGSQKSTVAGSKPRDKVRRLGGRATRQAVTRVKLEKASKVKLWMPTRPLTGEGRADRKETDKHLFGPPG